MLGDNIRKYRKLNNMSQDELAEKLQVTRQSISLWETGQTQPSLENIVALAKLFGVSTDELLTDDKSEPAPSSTVSTPADKAHKKKSKILLLSLCIVVVVALAVVVLLLIGGNDNSGNDTNNIQTTTTTTTTTATTTTTTTISGSSSTPEDTKKDIFGYLKDFAIQNGTINGDYCYYSKTSDNYGGYESEKFSLYYWGDTNTIEFCLHSVISDTFSINFYLLVPEEHSGTYEYISSYYYRDTGEPLYEAKGTIEAKTFTNNYPLNCTKYIGSTSEQSTFMEMSRQGICDLIGCLKEFIKVEKIKYSFEDFGFLKF